MKKNKNMAPVNKDTNKQQPLDRERLISLYMQYVLERGESPGTVYRFCKEQDMEEADFYEFFGSFEGLEKAVWVQFFDHTVGLMEKSSEYEYLSGREKMLTFYYTLFEVLTANRSYILFTLKRDKMPLKNLEQLKELRQNIRKFAKNVIPRSKEEKQQFRRPVQSETIFAEGAWLEFLFLLKFWINDCSPRFERTEVAIEKSVNTAFDLLDTRPLERMLDLGKFLWKEKMV